jgi:glycerol-3-phosphate dehydrogenase (NAD(P)+)
MAKISFYGFGAFNSALAHYFDITEKHEIAFYDNDPQVRLTVEKTGKHPHHFQDMKFSKRVVGVKNVKDLTNDAEFLLLGVPAQKIRESLAPLRGIIKKETMIVIVSKGLEIGTNKRPSEIIREELAHKKIAVFAGGTTASDVARGIPLIAEMASDDEDSCEKAAELFHSKTLRIYTNNDMVSVELSSALKNIVSIGSGICDGLGFTVGTKAAFITRATRDIYKIAKAMGAHDQTFLPGSASVWGDIILSSFGPTRNAEFGKRICASSPENVLEEMQGEHKTVEGYYTVKAAQDMSKSKGINTPCIDMIYKVVHEGIKPAEALRELFERKRTGI